jgi:hypothetical protein
MDFPFGGCRARNVGEAEFYLRFALLVVGGFVGFLLNVWLQSTKEQREARAAKYAIQAEMDCAARDAEAYLQPRAVKRVGWRLSLRMYQSGLPKLMYVGAIERRISDALVNYYQNLEAFNRSLDLVEDHYTDGRNEPAHREVDRAHLKAIEITSGDALCTTSRAGSPGFFD